MQPTRVDEEELPPRPVPDECCGGGCARCVLETYAEELARWEREVESILRRRAEQPNLPPHAPD